MVEKSMIVSLTSIPRMNSAHLGQPEQATTMAVSILRQIGKEVSHQGFTNRKAYQLLTEDLIITTVLAIPRVPT